MKGLPSSDRGCVRSTSRSVVVSRLILPAVFLANLVSAQIPKPNDAPGPLTPEQSAAAFKLPDGFLMEVVASEPLIASPSAVCWDERGRMFTVRVSSSVRVSS